MFLFKEKNHSSLILAIAASVACLISVIMTFGFFYGIQEELLSTGTVLEKQDPVFETVFLTVNLISFLLQVLLFLNWGSILNNRIKEISFFISDNLEKSPDQETKNDLRWLFDFLQKTRINVLPVFFYILCSLLGLVFSSLSLAMTSVSLIFLCFFLQNLFSSSSQLQDLLGQFYGFYLPSESKNVFLGAAFRTRGIFWFIVLTFLTGTLYWVYFFIKMTLEINIFLSIESENRSKSAEIFGNAGQR